MKIKLAQCATALLFLAGFDGQRATLTVGRGGLPWNDLTDSAGLCGAPVVGVLSAVVGVVLVTGLAGCERLWSGAWNV